MRFDFHVFGTFGAVKLNTRSSIPATKARMISVAKSVKFPFYFFEVFAKSSEYDWEFSFLFFQEDKRSKKRRNQMILSFSEEFHEVLLVLRELLLFFAWLHLLLIIISLLLIPERQSIHNLLLYFQGEVKLFFCTFGKSYSLKHLFSNILKLNSWSACKRKAVDPIFNNRLILFSIAPISWISFFQVFIVILQFWGCFSWTSWWSHWLWPRQLIMCHSPNWNLFLITLHRRSDFSPSGFTYDASDLYWKVRGGWEKLTLLVTHLIPLELSFIKIVLFKSKWSTNLRLRLVY